MQWIYCLAFKANKHLKLMPQQISPRQAGASQMFRWEEIKGERKLDNGKSEGTHPSGRFHFFLTWSLLRNRSRERADVCLEMKLISLLYALYVALDNSFSFTGGSLFSTYSSEADASVWLCASFHFSRNGPTETPAEIITQWEIKPVFAALPSSHVANHHFHSLTGVHFLTRRHSGKIRKSKVKR